MKIFISWSGKETISYKVAIALKELIPTIIQCVEPWISSEILSGDRWNEQIYSNLADSTMGIICITQENKNEPWLNFEAGAIAKGLPKNKVIPLLIDLKTSDISGPLTQYQAKSLSKDDMYKVINDINALCEKSIEKDRLDKLFNKLWDDFYSPIEEFKKVNPKQRHPATQRTPEDILEEVLALARDMKVEVSTLSTKIDKLDNNTYFKLPYSTLPYSTFITESDTPYITSTNISPFVKRDINTGAYIKVSANQFNPSEFAKSPGIASISSDGTINKDKSSDK